MPLQLHHHSRNISEHIIKPSRNIQIRVAQHRNALRLEPCGSIGVVTRFSRLMMLTAIELDGELDRRCMKIDDEIPDYTLAQESHTTYLAHAQPLPQGAFGRRLIATQIAGA